MGYWNLLNIVLANTELVIQQKLDVDVGNLPNDWSQIPVQININSDNTPWQTDLLTTARYTFVYPFNLLKGFLPHFLLG